MHQYAFNHASNQETARLIGLETAYDPSTRRCLTGLGLAPGWQCWEVGCGAGGIARWMAEQVGPTGTVLATDVDLRHANPRPLKRLRFDRHDITCDPIVEGVYDLVHCRAVLEHIPEREQVLGRLVSALRGGGWLVVEEFDIEAPIGDVLALYAAPEDAELLKRLAAALAEAMPLLGIHPGFGRGLSQRFAGLGLVQVGAEIHSPIMRGGEPSAFFPLTLARIRDALIATGKLSGAEFAALMKRLEDPGFSYAPNFKVATWGRREY